MSLINNPYNCTDAQTKLSRFIEDLSPAALAWSYVNDYFDETGEFPDPIDAIDEIVTDLDVDVDFDVMVNAIEQGKKMLRL